MRYLITLLFATISLSSVAQERAMLDSYNIVWNSQSQNSSESMPIGGCDVGLNVWVENNELLFYIAQTGTFDENNQMLKHGRVRMNFSPNPFEDAKMFKQTLRVEQGDIIIEGKSSDNDIRINIWVDAMRPVIHVDTKSKKALVVNATYETWREEDYLLPMEAKTACLSYRDYPGDVYTYKDNFEQQPREMRWYHRNRSDKLLRDFCIEQQGIEKYRDSIPDTQTNLTFGGVMSGSDMEYVGRTNGRYIYTDFGGYKYQTTKAVKENTLQIALEVGQYENLEQWHTQLSQVNSAAFADKRAQGETQKWWSAFWKRSYIFINPCINDASSRPWQVGRNYQLFRYMLGCNAQGEYPSKFNGSLFTFDPNGIQSMFVENDIRSTFKPDYRAWGGGSFTAQNQRLVYWPMLKSGDFDMMPCQFDYYKRTLSAAEARTKLYWGHQGACFVEQLENFGLPYAAGWGFESGKRKRSENIEWGVQDNQWIIYHYVNQLEFSLMIMDYHRFSGVDISAYMPFIKSSIRFFDEHYKYRYSKMTGRELDENGKLVFFPSTAAEMYKIAKNPVDLIAAMRAVVERIATLPMQYINESEKQDYLELLDRIPDFSYDIKDGHKVIKPAEHWAFVSNIEIPELYPLFPYGQFGLTKPNLDIAKSTWEYGESNKQREFTDCWSQVGIFAARLGLVDQASSLIIDKLSDSERRFPTFWGPGPDWVPDVDHGGAGMIALQEMLMQTEGDTILLFPAWDKSWDVTFKLHAPYNTIVEVTLENGKIEKLDVQPASRADDVVIMLQ